MVDCVWNTRVRKHNLKGTEKQSEHDSSVIKLNCISFWHFVPLRKKGMNDVGHDDKVYQWLACALLVRPR